MLVAQIVDFTQAGQHLLIVFAQFRQQVMIPWFNHYLRGTPITKPLPTAMIYNPVALATFDKVLLTVGAVKMIEERGAKEQGKS